jgi:hypothetical protein
VQVTSVSEESGFSFEGVQVDGIISLGESVGDGGEDLGHDEL